MSRKEESESHQQMVETTNNLPLFVDDRRLSRQKREEQLCYLLFGILGCQVGVWAVQLPDIVHSIAINTTQLGLALSVASFASIIALIIAGLVIDHCARRLFLLWTVIVMAVACYGSR